MIKTAQIDDKNYGDEVEIYDPAKSPRIFPKAPPMLSSKIRDLPLGDLLLPYQQRSIQAIIDNDVVVIEKSRRIGLTWGVASHAALEAAKSFDEGGMDVFYMGYEKDMAREFIDTVGMWAKAFSIAASEVDEFVFEKDADREIKAFRITFASGFEVVALPSKPRAFRGKQGLVILDEAAFMDDVQATIDAAMALLIWGGSVVIISTHYGADNPFNKIIQEIRVANDKAEKGLGEPSDYHLITITFDEAIKEGLYERVALVHRGKKPIEPKEAWISKIYKRYRDAADQELRCIPQSGGASWLTRESITACIHPEAGDPAGYEGGIAYIAQDVARRRDLSVIGVGELIGRILWLREMWAEAGVAFEGPGGQYAIFDDFMRRYRIVAGRVDQTGMGEPVVERYQYNHGKERIQGVLFTPPNRLALAVRLRDWFESGRIRISNDDAIIVDLLALKRAGKDGKALTETKDKHPDIFWMLALMVEAAEIAQTIYEYTSARASSPANDDDDDEVWGNKNKCGVTRHGITRGGAYG